MRGSRGGGLPHPRALPSRPLLPRPPLGRASYAVLGRVYSVERRVSAVQPRRGSGLDLALWTSRHVAHRRRLQAGNPGRPPRPRPSDLHSRVPGALAFAAWNVAVQKACPRRSSAVLHLMPVLTILFSYLLLGEALTVTQLIGIAVAVAGVYTSARG